MNDELKQAIANELNVDPSVLTSDKLLEELEYWDSVVVLSLMVIIADAVGKEIAPEDVAELRTFGDIEKLVASKLA
jgi:acyl carrier protein